MIVKDLIDVLDNDTTICIGYDYYGNTPYRTVKDLVSDGKYNLETEIKMVRIWLDGGLKIVLKEV